MRQLISQWPNRQPALNELPELPLLDVDEALLSVKPEWERLVDNHQLFNHLVCVQNLLNRCKSPTHLEKHSEGESIKEWYRSWRTATVRPHMLDLLCPPMQLLPIINGSSNIDATVTPTKAQVAMKPPTFNRKFIRETAYHPPADVTSSSLVQSAAQTLNRRPNIHSELQGIVSHFAKSEDPVRAAYGKDLSSSLSALQEVTRKGSCNPSSVAPVIDVIVLNQAISSSQEYLQLEFISICELMVKGHQWHQHGGLLPDITPRTLLEALQKGKGAIGSDTIQSRILNYAQSIVGLQHLLRIRNANLRKDTIQLASEARSVAHAGWRVEDHVDWLLLEIEFNLIIREDQLKVAQAMIASPSSTSNFVLQMNMGQGKSSVIIPMVAAALANGKNLVRVVVPRSLLLQAAQVLSSRLGGLLNRGIKHIPFSRKSPTDIESLKAYHNLHLETFNRRGIILALPEHLLSFQLSGLQELSNGCMSQSNFMIKLQAWFSRKARDILDECDHMLAVKTQLIYPSGAQSPVDGHPNRWKVVQVRVFGIFSTPFKFLFHDLVKAGVRVRWTGKPRRLCVWTITLWQKGNLSKEDALSLVIPKNVNGMLTTCS